MQHYLDASEMEPPEPMDRILELMAEMGPGEHIRMYHRMEPIPLYAILSQAGFRWRTDRDTHEMYHIFIWRASDTRAEADAAGHAPHLAMV